MVAPSQYHHRALTTATAMKPMRQSSPPVIPNITTAHSTDCVIGMGSNLGDRWSELGWAVEAVGRFGNVRRVSPVYETDPVGGPPQPQYLNAAFRFETSLGPVALLHALLGLEREAGRERRVRWGPRTLDLDILWIRGLVVSAPSLAVPHARLETRPFALRPLLDVAPQAVDPASGVAYAKVLASLPSGGMHQVGQLRTSRLLIG